MISGPLKMPFLAYTGRKIAPFPDATAFAISHPRDLKDRCFCPAVCKPSVQFTVYKKSRRDHRHYKSNRKFHIRQMLTLPERTSQFTVMPAAWSSTIERVNLHRFYIHLCAKVNLLQLVLASAEPLAPLGAAGPRRPGISREPASQSRVDRSGRRSWGVDNAVGVEHRRLGRGAPTRPRRAR
jgi:hypothetical protein